MFEQHIGLLAITASGAASHPLESHSNLRGVVHEQETTAYGRVPLIVTKPYGTGKVLFMGTDSAWRWREGVEDRYVVRHNYFHIHCSRWIGKSRGKDLDLPIQVERCSYHCDK